MPISIEHFMQALTTTGIMPAAEAATLVQTIPADKRQADADGLARDLVKQGKITRFQAAAIYQDKADGLLLGNYLILDKLGAGGMGQVFRARHRRMDRVVALKVLPKKLLDSPDAVARFQREAKAAARLTHPNIVTAHDADEAGGMHFLVMEFVDGLDLAALVKQQGPLPVNQALDYTLQAARGLEHAHGEGVVHRDIKPSNLLLDKKGGVKILDMGLARMSDPLADPSVTPGADPTHNDLTQSGSIMGTIDYMAPEQAMDSRQADARSDIYSLGCTFHFLLTGRPPYGGDTVLKRLTAHQQAAIPLISSFLPDVPQGVQEVFGRMVAKRPAARYQTCKELVAALEALRNQPTFRRPQPVMAQALPTAAALATPIPSGINDLESIMLPGIQPGSRKVRRSKSPLPLIAGAAVLVLAVVGGWLMFGQKPDEIAQSEPAPATDSQPSLPDISQTAAVEPKPTAEPPEAPQLDASAAESPPETMPAKIAPPASVTPVPAPAVAILAPTNVVPTPAIAPPTPPALASPAATSPVTVLRAAVPPAEGQLAAAPEQQAADAKLPIPSTESQRDSLKLLKVVYKDDYAQLKQPEAKAALAEKLLNESQQTQGDTAASYTILREARDLAVDAANPALAERAIGMLAGAYAVDPLKELSAALDEMSGKPHPADANHAIAEAALARIDEAQAAEDFETTKQLADVALVAARRAKDASLSKRAIEVNKSVTAAKHEWDAWQKAQATLAAKPDDPTANLTVGRYLCFVQGDWEQGLPLLAKGSDGSLKELAANSLKPTEDSTALSEIGDAWFSAAEKSKGKDKADLRAGAAYWYSRAEPGLTGLVKTKIEKRLAELGGKVVVAPTTSSGKLAETMELPLAPGVSMKLRLIPAGKFTMGRAGHAGTVVPHAVEITRPFYIGIAEVTQAQWLAVMRSNPSRTTGDFAFPVDNVSWDDCQDFTQRLNTLPAARNFRFRLPTEAEWEYACRAGTATEYCFGNDPAQLSDYAWFKDNSGGAQHAVAKLKPNAWGLYDIHGSGWEWCSDWYDADYYNRSAPADPTGPETGEKRVLRGGSRGSDADGCRTPRRHFDVPALRSSIFTLRVVCQPKNLAPATKSAPRDPPSAAKRAVGAAPTISSGKLAETMELPLAPGVGMKFRLISAGKFTMGRAGNSGNYLAHAVQISTPFYLGITEVTQAQWLAVMGDSDGKTTGNVTFPVGHISWVDCQNFLQMLNQSPLAGSLRFRLPTEAEWEYSCRAGANTEYCFGDDPKRLSDYAWFKDNSGGVQHAVAQLKPNVWGLYDMHGNNWEWCSDWYDADYYKHSPDSDPAGSEKGEKRILRGGSWKSSDAEGCSSPHRNPSLPELAGANVTLRVVCQPKNFVRATKSAPRDPPN